MNSTGYKNYIFVLNKVLVDVGHHYYYLQLKKNFLNFHVLNITLKFAYTFIEICLCKTIRH